MENRTAALKNSKMNLQAIMMKTRSSESESEISKY